MDHMSRIADELARILDLTREYCEASAAESPVRLGIIQNQIDERSREQFPPAGSPDQTREPGTVIPFLAPLPKAG
jgi:hypothetical protein